MADYTGGFTGAVNDASSRAAQAQQIAASQQAMMLQAQQQQAAQQALQRQLAYQRLWGTTLDQNLPRQQSAPPLIPAPQPGMLSPGGGNPQAQNPAPQPQPIAPAQALPPGGAPPGMQPMPQNGVPPPPTALAGPGGPAPAPQAPQPIPPFRALPTGAGGPQGQPQVPPPPQPPQMQAPQAPASGGADQFSVQNLVGMLRKSGVPPEEWGGMLDNLPEPIKNNAAMQIKMLDSQNKALTEFSNLQIRKQRADAADKAEQDRTKAAQDKAAAGGTDPFMKEAEALYGKGTPAYKAALQKHIDKMDAPARTTINMQGASGLSGDAIDNAADRYNLDGTLPSNMPRGGAMAVKVLNRAAEKQHAAGNTGDEARIRQLANKETTKALGFTIKRNAGIDQGMRKIANDIKTMESLMPSGNAGLVQFLNKPLNAVRTQTSDPKLAAWSLSVKQVANEYERQLTGGMMSNAQLHAGAAEDAKNIINENMSIKEIEAIVPVMMREMKNNYEAGKSQEKELRESMGSGAPKAAPLDKPKVGEVVDGYRYLGGDPKNPKSWTNGK